VVADTAALLRHLAVMIQNKSGHLPSIRCAPHFPDLIAIEQAKAMLESGMNLQLDARD
jgi:hypothetical protein